VIYLIEYDRESGSLLRLMAFSPADRRRAEEERLKVELDLLKNRIAREVVLLEASNEEELRKTHRRYFERLDELLTTSAA
jgi:hypothetical protein